MLITEEKRIFCDKVEAQSQRLVLPIADYVYGRPRDNAKLVELKTAVKANQAVQDVLLFSDSGVSSLLGTPKYDVLEEFSVDVKKVRADKEDYSLVLLKSVNPEIAKKQWIGVLWRESPSFRVRNETLSYLAVAVLKSVGLLLLMIPALLLIRLLSETAILVFMFVDEIVSIHGTIKKGDK